MSARSQSLGDMRKVARAGASVLMGSLFGNGLSYLYSIFLARNLSPREFGVYALGLTVFSVVVLIAPLGFETGALRFISHALGRDDRRGAQRVIVQVTILVILSSLGAAVLLAVSAPWLSRRVYANAELARALWWFAAAVPLAVVSTVLLDVIRSFQLVRYTVLVKYVWEPCGKFVLGALLLWAGYALTGVLGALLLTSALSVVLALIAARRVAAFAAGDGPQLKSQGLMSLFMYCLPLTVSNVFGVIAPRSDMLILGMWVSPEEVGVYSVAAQTAAILALILAAFATMCTPMFGEMAATHDLKRLQGLYATVARWTTACTVPLFCLFAVFGEEILALFGKRFAAGATAMVILALGQVIYSAVGLASTVLLMFGHSRKIMTNTILLALLLIGSNWLLVPRWGIIGAASAVALSNAAIGFINLWQVRSLYGVLPLGWNLAKPVCAGAIASLLAWSVKGLFTPALLPLLVVLAGVVYALTLFLLRFEASDRQVFASIVARIRPA
jgi:O-antigen/teichoic acid export membrane protein